MNLLLAFLAFFGTVGLSIDQQEHGTGCHAIVRDADGNGMRTCHIGSLVITGPVGDATTVAEIETQWAAITGSDHEASTP